MIISRRHFVHFKETCYNDIPAILLKFAYIYLLSLLLAQLVDHNNIKDLIASQRYATPRDKV